MILFQRVQQAATAVALVLAVVACNASSTPSTSAPAATTPPSPTSGAASSAPSATAGTTAGKVSANTATSDELVAALQAAGVPNADRWAREVMEYRPYDTSDPTLQHLQDNLAKYNPDPATLAAILSALTP
jgi:DNA uptake protein ComE-like DNA-binding protein